MEDDRFDEPVRIFVGLNFHREISSVGEAHAFLTEWPERQRWPSHTSALKACKATLSGEADVEATRAAFATFADRMGILAPEVDDVIAAQAVGVLPSRSRV